MSVNQSNPNPQSIEWVETSQRVDPAIKRFFKGVKYYGKAAIGICLQMVNIAASIGGIYALRLMYNSYQPVSEGERIEVMVMKRF